MGPLVKADNEATQEVIMLSYGRNGAQAPGQRTMRTEENVVFVVEVCVSFCAIFHAVT